MAKIAVEKQFPFKNGEPSLECMECFRALHCNRSSTRAFPAKDKSKAVAEHPHPVGTCKLVLQIVEMDHPFILGDPRKFLNIDGTKLDKTQGLKSQVFRPHWKHRRSHLESSSSSDKHVTAVITTNVPGEVLPPQVVVEGKLELKKWYELLPKYLVNDIPEMPFLAYEG